MIDVEHILESLSSGYLKLPECTEEQRELVRKLFCIPECHVIESVFVTKHGIQAAKEKLKDFRGDHHV